MEESEKDTLPNLQTIIDAISGLRQEITEKFTGVEQRLTGIEQRLTNVEQRLTNVEQRLTNVEQRLTSIENDVREVKEMQFVFENEFDRLTALSYKSLELSHENRADVRIMRREIEAWTGDIKSLLKQNA